MLYQLFPSTISITSLGLPENVRGELRNRALKAYQELNENRKPWGRKSRISLQEHDPVFETLFKLVWQRTESEYGVRLASITGRELIQYKHDFVPPHVESSALSAIYWIAGEAKPDPKHQEYDGCLVLQHPAGGFGNKTIPQDQRVRMIEPKVDQLLIFPSHLLHFGHVYLGDNPSVEVHFEMEIS